MEFLEKKQAQKTSEGKIKNTHSLLRFIPASLFVWK